MSEEKEEKQELGKTEETEEPETTVAEEDEPNDLEEVTDEERDFEMKNIIGFIVGFLVLLIGLITMGTGSTSLSPFLIIGGYVIIGIFLII
ncbi:MAG: hypothetical protein QGH40_04725 [bacterium]|jgi:hypothetical protein|nr:hypothetical protein [bacterium]